MLIYFSDQDIDLLQQCQPQFVSLKYLDPCGHIKQIDFSVQNLDNIQDNKLLVYNSLITLKTIARKAFTDPFRNVPTITFFCDNIHISNHYRINQNDNSSILLQNATISFFIQNHGTTSDLSALESPSCDKNYQFAIEPMDKYSNLRNDIISALENIGIKTTASFHGKYHTTQFAESVICISGNDIIDLIDNIIIAQFIIMNVVNNYGMRAIFAHPNTGSQCCLSLNLLLDHNVKLSNDTKEQRYDICQINDTQSAVKIDITYNNLLHMSQQLIDYYCEIVKFISRKN